MLSLAPIRKNITVSLLIKISVALYLAILVPYQVDPHHDGYILGFSAAVADGLPVHSGAFSQYGPFTAWLAGFFLQITSVNVFNLRVLSGILIFLTYFLLEKTLQKLKFTRNTSQLVSLSWILINQVTSTSFDGAFFLWPSLVSTLLLMVALNLILIAIESKNQKFFFFLSGIVLSLAFFTRIQSILVVIILSFFWIFFIRDISKILYLLSGFMSGVILIYTYLASIGAFRDYFEQVIIWPSTVYPSLGSGNNYNRFQFLLYLSLPMLCLGYFWFTKSVYSKLQRFSALTFMLITGIFMFFVFSVSGKLLLSDKNTYLRLIVGDQLNRVLFWPIYFCYLGTVFLALLTLLTFMGKSIKPVLKRQEFVYSTCFGLSVTPQIFPQPDVAHLWWITPLLIPPTLTLLKALDINFEKFKLSLVSILIAALLASLSYLQRDWAPYSYLPLLGTYAQQQKVNTVEVYQPLSKFLQTNNAVFLCNDGLHAVAALKYSSVDQWFVRWGPADINKEKIRLMSSKNIVVCDQVKSISDELAVKYNLKLTYFDEKLNGDTYRSLAILVKNQ
jgi:hypothetical protein